MLSHPPTKIPADWSNPTNPASERKYGDAADLPHFPTTPEFEKHLTDLARGNLQNIADFFRSHKELTFVFIASTPESIAETIDIGPSLHTVIEMLRQQPQTKEANTTLCSQTWDDVTLLLEELSLRDDIRFILLYRLSDEDYPEISHSHHYTRKSAWSRVRYQIPGEHRDKIPAKPPSSAQKAKYEVTPAPPTPIIQKPMLPPNTRWPHWENHSPFREPAWRWNRAYSLLQHDVEPSEESDDESTMMAFEFLRSVVGRPHIRKLHRIRQPAMYFSNALRTGDSQRRLELECRLLTEQPFEEIAKIFSVKQKTIERYHDVFYDVRSCLLAKTYILKRVIGKGTGANSFTIEGYSKMLAWRGGRFLFEKAWPYLTNGFRELLQVTSGEEIVDPFAERLLLLFQALNLPDDLQTQKTLLRLESRLPDRFSITEQFPSFLGVMGQTANDVESDIMAEGLTTDRKKTEKTECVLTEAA